MQTQPSTDAAGEIPADSSTASAGVPARFERPSILSLILMITGVSFLVVSFNGAEVSLSRFIEGIPQMREVLGEMFPPDFSRADKNFWKLVETLQMALVGTFLGVIISFPLASLASTATTPNRALYSISRAVISLFRTIPDLIWALFFVATVGLGAFAGVLTLMVDTIGFCGRFFAEAMEETDSGPREALTALGASQTGILFSCVVPGALPSFINTTLFSLEKAVRSSVVLGLVGAGGIGMELSTAMESWRYDQALATMLLILALVIIVERISTGIRAKILA